MISIIYITSRKKPRFDWFVDSLQLNLKQFPLLPVELIFVDYWKDERDKNKYDSDENDFEQIRVWQDMIVQYKHVAPLPSFCQGPHKITKTEYFSASTARNTGFGHAKYDYVVFVDDASVLGPQWLKAVVEGMRS
ncbi:MAG: glycosyltransferase family A protein, partial [Patescibacteria group bacterium]